MSTKEIKEQKAEHAKFNEVIIFLIFWILDFMGSIIINRLFFF